MTRLRDAFLIFHAENPHVYKLFCKFAWMAINSGRTRLGARMIWERMRWYTRVETDSQSLYKLNDHLHPYYARLFMEDNPDYRGFFETRATRSGPSDPAEELFE